MLWIGVLVATPIAWFVGNIGESILTEPEFYTGSPLTNLLLGLLGGFLVFFSFVIAGLPFLLNMLLTWDS